MGLVGFSILLVGFRVQGLRIKSSNSFQALQVGVWGLGHGYCFISMEFGVAFFPGRLCLLRCLDPKPSTLQVVASRLSERPHA